MITSDIITGLLGELKYLLGSQGTYLLDTQLNDDFSGNFPLVILELGDDPGGVQLGNRTTSVEYDIYMRVYNYEPNAYDSDDGGYATTQLDIIDKVRQYFENEVWQTNNMVNLTNNFAFRMEYQGRTKAEPLQADETLVMGYKLHFASMAYDLGTDSTNDFLEVNQNIAGSVNFQDQ